MSKFSKAQIDKLGDRLRDEAITEEDLRMLDEYRRAYGPIFQEVVKKIRAKLIVEPTGRPAKSTPSIIEKLRRTKTKHSRLSQIQDIAGCRIIADDMIVQEEVVKNLKEVFSDVYTVDRREVSSHGYRAIHAVIKEDGRLIEVQIRTKLQHLWAETSEKIADLVDARLKYGEGPQEFKEYLSDISDFVKEVEDSEKHLQLEIQGISGEAKIRLNQSLNELKIRDHERFVVLFSRLVASAEEWKA